MTPLRHRKAAGAIIALTIVAAFAGIPERNSAHSPEDVVDDGDRVMAELRRIFETAVIRGEGSFDNNDSLARQSALGLAQTDLVRNIQSEVRGNAIFMNDQEVRSVVDAGIIANYDVDAAGFEPNSSRYRVRISIKGEQLVREIARRRGSRF